MNWFWCRFEGALVLFQFLVRLLLVIFQIHYGLLSQLQITLQLSFGPLKIHAKLLFLLQRAFKLSNNKTELFCQWRHTVKPWRVTSETYIIHLLLKFGLGLGQSINFVFLSLQIIKSLLMSLLKSFLLLGQLSNALILRGHFLSQVFHLIPKVRWVHCYSLRSSPHSTLCDGQHMEYTAHTLFSVACFSFSTLARVSSKSSMSFFSSEHSSSSFLFLAVSSALISSSSSSLSVVSFSLASSWILLLIRPSHLSSASDRFSDSYVFFNENVS